MKATLRFSFLLLTIMLQSGAWSQQQSVFTNILNNPLYFTPAYTGSTNYHEVSIYNRSQWAGFKDAPRNYYASFQGSYRNKAKHGYGLQLFSESAGIVTKTGFSLNYGYQLRLNSKWKLGFGIRPGFVQYRLRFYDAVIADEGDYVFSGNVYTTNALDMSTGFRIYTDTFEFSGSVDHLIGNRFNLSSYNQNLQWHYNVQASYKFKAGKKWEIRPAILFRYTKAIPSQVSLIFQGTYMGKFFGGLTFRSEDACGIYAGWRYKDRLTLTYAYDYSWTSMRRYQNGSHEFGIAYILTKNRPSTAERDDQLNNSILEEIRKEMKNNK